MVSKKFHKKGFTLVEFLFVAFTMALFMTALFRITQGGLRAYQRGVVQTELKHELRNIMDRVVTDVRQASPGDFTTPTRDTSTYLGMLSGTIDFRRYKYAADNTVPTGDTRVVYTIENFQKIIYNMSNGDQLHMADLVRSETTGGTTVTTTLSRDYASAITIAAMGASTIKSGFRWTGDPLSGSGPFGSPYTGSNIDVLEVHVTIAKSHSGSSQPEVVSSSSMAALRAGKSLAAGSNYYPPTAVTDPYANLQRFGNPTSLVKP